MTRQPRAGPATPITPAVTHTALNSTRLAPKRALLFRLALWRGGRCVRRPIGFRGTGASFPPFLSRPDKTEAETARILFFGSPRVFSSPFALCLSHALASLTGLQRLGSCEEGREEVIGWFGWRSHTGFCLRLFANLEGMR
jgi:hypothetical protein